MMGEVRDARSSLQIWVDVDVRNIRISEVMQVLIDVEWC